MALLFMDSFDHYSSSQCQRKWAAGGASISSAYGRLGSAGAYVANSYMTSPVLPVSGNVFIVGSAVYRSGTLAGSFGAPVLGCRLGPDAQLSLYFVEGRIRVSNNTTYWESTQIYAAESYRYIELKATIDTGTYGSFEVRVNGETWLTQSNVNTAAHGEAGWDTLHIANGAWSGHWYDDLYVLDGSGTHANDFLGDCQVECLKPQTGNGSNTDWTCSTGTDHGALVDEATPNDNTDYVYSTSVGDVDTYNLPSLTLASGTVYGVQTNLCAAKATSGERSIRPVLRHSSTDYEGTSRALGDSYVFYSEIFEHNPGTSANWVIADVNALEFGIKVQA